MGESYTKMSALRRHNSSILFSIRRAPFRRAAERVSISRFPISSNQGDSRCPRGGPPCGTICRQWGCPNKSLTHDALLPAIFGDVKRCAYLEDVLLDTGDARGEEEGSEAERAAEESRLDTTTDMVSRGSTRHTGRNPSSHHPS